MQRGTRPSRLLIAATKMLLVVLFFMHAKYTHGLTQVVILCGFFFLALLVAFTLADELTRQLGPATPCLGRDPAARPVTLLIFVSDYSDRHTSQQPTEILRVRPVEIVEIY